MKANKNIINLANKMNLQENNNNSNIKITITSTQKKVKHIIEPRYIDSDVAVELMTRFFVCPKKLTKREKIWCISVLRAIEHKESIIVDQNNLDSLFNN